MPEIDLSICPSDEQSAQVRTGKNYMPAMRKQATRFLRALQRRWPDLPHGVRFEIKTNPHDFGDYLTVVISYPEDATESQLRYVVALEGAISEERTWEELEADG